MSRRCDCFRCKLLQAMGQEPICGPKPEPVKPEYVCPDCVGTGYRITPISFTDPSRVAMEPCDCEEGA